MPNFARLVSALALAVTAGGGNIKTAVVRKNQRRVRMALALLGLTFAVPAVLFITGMIVGSIGYALESQLAVSTARIIFATGALTAAVLSVLTWTKALWYVHVIGFLTRGVAYFDQRLPVISLAEADKFLVWLRGWSTWFAAACLYLALVPMWRSWFWTFIVLTAMLVGSGVMSSRWSESKWPQRVVSYGTILVLLAGTFFLVFDSAGRQVDEWLGWHDLGVRHSVELSRIDSEERASENESLASLKERFSQERRDLIKAMAGCDGQFCSEVDRRNYIELGQKIAWIDDGSYINRMQKRSDNSSGGTSADDDETVELRPPPAEDDDEAEADAETAPAPSDSNADSDASTEETPTKRPIGQLSAGSAVRLPPPALPPASTGLATPAVRRSAPVATSSNRLPSARRSASPAVGSTASRNGGDYGFGNLDF